MLIGLNAPDDAGVYKVTDDVALVQTVDFFTPVVDDPYAFGQIAAANSISDVYAMGAKPVTALNVFGYPSSQLPPDTVADILRGGQDKVHEAGASIIGGHSVDDGEPKYGLAVTGFVHPERLITKGGARPGDVLVLTKPIGIGTITTAIKRGLVPEPVVAEAVATMTKLNDVVDVLHDAKVKGATDVTGFGLLGHAAEMARAGQVGLRIEANRVPVIEAAYEYAEKDVFPGGTRANRRFLEPTVSFADTVNEPVRMLLCDAITSGGLLIACPPARLDDLLQGLTEANALRAAIVGQVVPEHPGHIEVV